MSVPPRAGVSTGEDPLARTAVLLLAALTGACGTALTDRPPLGDPAAAARDAAETGGRDRPALLRFDWYYSDDRGDVRGEGVGRYNPPDSVRLDLFTSGEANTAVALTDSSLRARQEIEDVELPGSAFLYAMAGFFRPPGPAPAGGYVLPDGRALRYRTDAGTVRDFYLEDGRLVRLEERRRGHLLRRVSLAWDTAGAWPRRAEYRDFTEARRVEWELTEARWRSDRFAPGIYDLPRRAGAHD